ncbi:matrixin family metalloprotease [Sorangium sp. So ce385]
MNFGWLTLESTQADVESVVLHEFGHALGLIHEHQHPENGIK